MPDTHLVSPASLFDLSFAGWVVGSAGTGCTRCCGARPQSESRASTERWKLGRRQRPRPLGDPTQEQRVARIFRLDHAGEYGAKRIYEG